MGWETDFAARFELGAELGRGQFGVVRACTERRTGAEAACKSIPKAMLTTAEAVEDVRREVAIMKTLAGHGHVVGYKGAPPRAERRPEGGLTGEGGAPPPGAVVLGAQGCTRTSGTSTS